MKMTVENKMVENKMVENKMDFKKILLFFFIISLIIRLLYGFIIFQNGNENDFKGDNDHWEYINYARNIISQGIFVPDIKKLDTPVNTPYGLRGANASLVGPGFPLIIASVFKVFGDNYFSFYVLIFLNALASSALVVLIFYIGRELFTKNIGLWAALWSIFYIPFIIYIHTLYKDNWAALFFPLLILLFIKETKRTKLSFLTLILFSIFYAYFIHLDERFFIYFPVLLIGFVLFDQESRQKGLQKALVFSVAVVVLMVPWLIRNFNAYHRVVILTERTARFTDKIFGYKEEVEKLRDREELELSLLEKTTELILAGKEIPADMVNTISVSRDVHWLEPLIYGIKLGYIPHRYSFWEKVWANFKEFWRPFLLHGEFVWDGFQFVGPAWSLKHNILSCLNYAWLLPFLIAGIIFSVINKNKYAIFIALIIIMHTFFHVILPYITDRYRVPIDAFVLVMAFYGMQQSFAVFQNLSKSRRK